MAEPILVAESKEQIFLLPKMANRHGLIAGATGTGKTVTLQTRCALPAVRSAGRSLADFSEEFSVAAAGEGSTGF
jgi:hypothetical protein